MTPSWWARRRPGASRDDSGFSLIEVVVSLVILVIVASVTIGLLVNTFAVGRTNTQRQAASNLAAKAIAAAQSQDSLAIIAGTSTASVDGTTYTTTQTTKYVSGNSGTGVCAGGANSTTFRLVTDTVTWPNMGTTQPVQESTLRPLDSVTGVAAVQLNDSQNNPVPNIQVTLSTGATQTTDSSGCAVFTGLSTAGTFVATVNTAGYVGQASTTKVQSNSFGVVAAGVTNVVMYYAPAGSVNVQLSAPSGYPAPSGFDDFTLSNTALSPSVQPAPSCSAVSGALQYCATLVGGAPQLQNLYPGPWSIWPGTCADATPSPTPTVSVPQGSATTLIASLGGVNLSFPSSWDGYTIYAKHNSDSGCTNGATYTIGSAAGTSAQFALPPGSWNVGLGVNHYATVNVTATQVTAGSAT